MNETNEIRLESFGVESSKSSLEFSSNLFDWTSSIYLFLLSKAAIPVECLSVCLRPLGACEALLAIKTIFIFFYSLSFKIFLEV